MSLQIVYILVRSSKDLEGAQLAIVEHRELQGGRKTKKLKIKYATVIEVIHINSNGY